MICKNTARIVLSAIFVSFILAGCKSTVDEVTMNTCKAIESNIAKCSELIADDISDTNANTLSSVNEGDLWFKSMNIVEHVSFETEGYQIMNITEKIQELVILHQFRKGLVNLSILHTSASLTVQENASQDVLHDIRTFLRNLVPNSANYLHDVEGPDDMPAHLKTLITNTNLTLSVVSNKLVLGVWQGIYLCEWRKFGKTRSVIVHLLGK